MGNRSTEGKLQSAAQSRSAEASTLRPTLSVGEHGLILRALRYYISGEQRAVQDAVIIARATSRAKDKAHADDVKRQSDAHIAAAQALHAKLSGRDAGVVHPEGFTEHTVRDVEGKPIEVPPDL